MDSYHLLELILSWPTLTFSAFIIFIIYFKNKLFIERIKIKDMEVEFKEVTQKVETQGKELIEQQSRINSLVHYAMSDELFDYLCTMNDGPEFIFCKNRGFTSRLEYLIFNNYIYALKKLNDYNDGDNIFPDIVITEKGHEYIKLRKNA